MYAGGANLMSLLFINVYRIYIHIVSFSSPLCWWVTKKRRKFWVYICMFICFYAYICFMHIHMHILLWFWYPNLLLHIHFISILVYMFYWYLSFIEYIICMCFMILIAYSLLLFIGIWALLNILKLYAMHELNGSFYKA